ncbi:MAG: C4-dicarboxylate transporter DctA [Archangium gephyra]|uniref:C4-dicarboxylate transporter DctA n=1 Tax=Archangium gephyra TaxID=48 RepID=A0A2W5TS49_9BACT|nr:MAG: C4-dicarboxylate transporter DctA [Archangium gephyra]
MAAPGRKGSTLYIQVLIAVALGIALGVVKPTWGQALEPVGAGFVKLIKMLIAPIVFTTVAVGIAGMGDLKKVGRVGAKALVWFEAMTTVALALGLLVVNLVGPGRGIHARVEALDTSKLDKTLSGPRPHGIIEHLQAIIPDSFVGAFTNADVLQVLLLAVLTGVAVAGLGERGQPIVHGLEKISSMFFALVGVVMRLAPIGAFGAMAFTIGKFGFETLGNLLQLILSFYATALLFVFGVLGLALRLVGLSIFKLVRHMKDELVLVLGTSSSESALPDLMTKLEKLGCGGPVVRLVVPTGYSFNLDGTCIYLTMASVFVAQALDQPFTLSEQLALLAVLLLTSKGAASVTGSGFVTLAATLQSVGTVPVAGLSLLIGIDRFMSEARALTNLVGNAVATIVVSKWEGALDLQKARDTLDRKAL